MSEDESKDLSLRELVRHSLTMQEQQRIDNVELTKVVYNIAGDMKVYNEQHANIIQHLIDSKKDIGDCQTDIDKYKADRNKIIGMSWWGAALGTLGGIGELILHFFKK